jgi:putative tricarboxylic transport membrane protein
MTPLRFALFLVALCFVAAWQVTEIPVSPMYAVVDAGFVPKVVLAVLALCVLVYTLNALRGKEVDVSQEDQESSALPGSTARLLFFMGGMLSFLLLIKPLGFVLSASLAGVGVARSFDAQGLIRPFAMSLGIAVGFWVLFDRVLSVNLGPLLPTLLFGSPS